MKMTMDLLPSQYKCVPRDWRAIFIFVMIIAAIPAMWFGLKKYHDYSINKIEKGNEEEINELKTRISTVSNDIAQLESQLNKAMISREKIKEINERIDFFNRIYQKSFLWYEFFDKLEKLTPQEVWIKEIKISGDSLKEQSFKVICESKEPYHAPEFLKNLMQNREFVPPSDDKNTVDLSEVRINQAFGYEFSLDFKFYPFKKIIADPEKLIMNLNDEKVLKAYVVNIMEQKKELASGTYFVETVNFDGNVSYNENTGAVKALKSGKGFLKLVTSDKKFSQTIDYEVLK